MNQKRPNEVFPALINFYAEGEIAKTPAVAERFKQMLNRVWERIPGADRQIIEDFVEGTGQRLGIQLRDEHHNFSRGRSGKPLAQCIWGCHGGELLFKSLFIKNLTTDTAERLIAHEFAHLYLFITDATHGRDYTKAEVDVDELLDTRWGYKPDGAQDIKIEDWLIGQGHQIDGAIVVK